MSAPPDSRERVLEANVRALFARAYRAVEIRAGFEEQVRARATAALRRPAAFPYGRALLAAAASFAIAMFAVFAWERSDAARERILRRGDVAVREAAGPWVRWGPEREGLALRARTLDVAVPEGRRAAVGLGSGEVALLGPARARFDAPGAGAAAAGTRVAAAVPLGLSARGFQGRLEGAFGRFECAAADLALACETGGRARALLSGGAATFQGPDGRRAELALHRVFDSGAAAAAGSGTAVGAALPAASGEREPIARPATALPSAPGAAPALGGTVRDGAGRPVREFRLLTLAEVELPGWAEVEQHPCADEQGQFALEGPLTGPTTVYVRAEGFALWTREHLRPGSEPLQLDVVLERGGAAAGRVIDAETGLPLAGAVVLSEADYPGSLLPFDADACEANPAAVALTDADGRFRLEHLAAHPTVLRATRAGYGPGWTAKFTPDPAGGQHVLALSPGGALAGRVERADGSPWAQAVVIAMPQSALFQLRRSYAWGEADAAGGYRIEDLPPGSFVAVRIDMQAFDSGAEGLTEVRDAKVPAGGTGVANFLAPPRGSRFAGRALRAAGTPLARATVSIMRVADPSGMQGTVPDSWRSQTTGADGRFEFTDVEPGRYEVYFGVRTPMDVVRVDAVEIARDANVSRDVFAPAGELAGSVRSAADQRGLANAVVVLESAADGSECQFAAKLFTDDAGRWRAPWLADGRYRVRVYPGRGLAFAGRDEVEVLTGREVPQIDFELHPGSALELTVSDGAARPLAGIEVRLLDERGLEFQPAQDSRTDARGRLSVDGVPAGRVRVVLHGPDGARTERALVAVPPEPLALAVTLAAGGK